MLRHWLVLFLFKRALAYYFFQIFFKNHLIIEQLLSYFNQLRLQPTGTIVYAAVEKKEHHRTVSDLEQKSEPEVPGPKASTSEVMKYRLRTAKGRARYKLRQQTVEPVFGIIKSILGFRQFLLRGLQKVQLEWQWVCLAYNLKRLHRMGAGLKMAAQG